MLAGWGTACKLSELFELAVLINRECVQSIAGLASLLPVIG
jgi:hypothetical protein